MTADLVAFGAVSALGCGPRACDVGEIGAIPTTVVGLDAQLASAGLAKPYCARVELAASEDDRAATLVRLAAEQLLESLHEHLPDFRNLNVGLAIGTSSGGMASIQRAVHQRTEGTLDAQTAMQCNYFAPLARLRAALDLEDADCVQVLAACASSTIAIGLGLRWIQAECYDLVIVGGYDAVSDFVAAGFEALGATSARPAPFRLGRDGLALGEGAALCALARPDLVPHPIVRLSGFGASSDAFHPTAPAPDGRGLLAAARRALSDAGKPPEAIDVVSAHGTATLLNDAAEARAIESLFGSHAARVHAFKGVIGHTLGAAGVLEWLALVQAGRKGVVPASVGDGSVEPGVEGRLPVHNVAANIRTGLKLSSAFGGANAALVFGSDGRVAPRTRRRVALGALGPVVDHPSPGRLGTVPGISTERIARLDAVSLLALLAAEPVLPHGVSLDRVGVVVGTEAATLEINDEFERRRSQRGAEPRRFPATSPNLAPGNVALAFGLRGPTLSVGSGPGACLEAAVVAHDLVAAGDADAMLVIAVEHVGAFVRDVWAAAGWRPPAAGAAALALVHGEGRGTLDRALLLRSWRRARAPGAVTAGGWLALTQAFGGQTPPVACP